MAHHEIETQWMGKMQFNSLINDHTIVMDAPERVGGEDNGPIPKPFVLTALSGCTGMDIVTLLRKANVFIEDFNMKVKGDLSKQIPWQYVAIHITYEFIASEEVIEQIMSAVDDSQEKYCGVSSMLKKAIPVTWDITLNNKLIFTNLGEEAVV
ncbi:MAG: OsmC family protein [Saprospiraceae bacterium]